MLVLLICLASDFVWCIFLLLIAVKCNNEPAILDLLAKHGLGFDCASKGEIQTILNLGVPANRIIFANPCKQASHVKYAAANNVSMMTFDNEQELHKIKSICPDAQLVIRIRVDDSKSVCQVSLCSHCSVFKFIRFCRYPAPVYIAPFLYKRGEKNIRFCAFTLLTKTDKNSSVFVIYDRSHCSVFVKLHKGAEALTLFSDLKLIVANSLIKETGKT